MGEQQGYIVTNGPVVLLTPALLAIDEETDLCSARYSWSCFDSAQHDAVSGSLRAAIIRRAARRHASTPLSMTRFSERFSLLVFGELRRVMLRLRSAGHGARMTSKGTILCWIEDDPTRRSTPG